MPDQTAAEIDVAWISRGRLFVKRGGSPVQEIESDFARNSLEREQRHSQNNSWKGRSGVWGNMGMAPPGEAPWENVDNRRTIRFVTMTRGDSADEIYYVLDLGAVGGLFKYDFARDEETRLVHSQDFQALDLSRHPEDGRIAISTRRDDGTVGLSITRNDGLFGKDVTLTDTIDEAPCWLADGSACLVFQSSAIGRNDHGVAMGQSTCRIESMDLDKEEINSLLEEDDFDLLQPRTTNDGTVMCIRRPYKASHHRPPSLLEVAESVVLFPFRLGRTFVHMFHFMSMAFTGKPLIPSGGPEKPENKEQPFMMLYGQAVDTRIAMKKGAGKDTDKPLVPKEWELVSNSPDGEQEVLARNVLAFDANAAGDVVYTDGRRVFRIMKTGACEKLSDGDQIQKVAILG